MPTREHLRAQDALKKVREIPKDWASAYRGYVDRLGPAILRNGLGQALAGELAAAGGEGGVGAAHRSLHDNLQSWLCGGAEVYAREPLLDALIEGGEAEYLRAHAEALAWLEWHKRFCRAYLPKKTDAEPTADGEED